MSDSTPTLEPLRDKIALIIDANYHTAISKALSTADKIVAEVGNDERLKALRKASDALHDISHWRKGCHDTDADLGHEPRYFADGEDWEILEDFATREAAKARTAIARTQEQSRCDQCGKKGGGHHPACIINNATAGHRHD